MAETRASAPLEGSGLSERSVACGVRISNASAVRKPALVMSSLQIIPVLELGLRARNDMDGVGALELQEDGQTRRVLEQHVPGAIERLGDLDVARVGDDEAVLEQLAEVADVEIQRVDDLDEGDA